MSALVTMKDLLEAGVHFGHQTSRWNPKMKPYIFGARNGIYIIDLQKTVGLVRDALKKVTELGAQGKKVLFVGTKAQARDVMREQAERCGCPYVSERWLGGTLTNFVTIQGCVNTLEKIQSKKDSGAFDQLPNKEKAATDKEYDRLMKNLGGIRKMSDLPGALFVVDPSKEHNAVAEARVLGIPVISITDTNCDPDLIDFVIPGNDDALKSIRLFATAVADAVLDGAKLFEDRVRAIQDKREIEAKIAITQPQKVEDSKPKAAAVQGSGTALSATDREGRTVNVSRKVTSRPTDKGDAPGEKN
jgi:small subunit ribosomal protein S2